MSEEISKVLNVMDSQISKDFNNCGDIHENIIDRSINKENFELKRFAGAMNESIQNVSFEDCENNENDSSVRNRTLNLTCLADQFNKLHLGTPAPKKSSRFEEDYLKETSRSNSCSSLYKSLSYSINEPDDESNVSHSDECSSSKGTCILESPHTFNRTLEVPQVEKSNEAENVDPSVPLPFIPNEPSETEKTEVDVNSANSKEEDQLDSISSIDSMMENGTADDSFKSAINSDSISTENEDASSVNFLSAKCSSGVSLADTEKYETSGTLENSLSPGEKVNDSTLNDSDLTSQTVLSLKIEGNKTLSIESSPLTLELNESINNSQESSSLHFEESERITVVSPRNLVESTCTLTSGNNLKLNTSLNKHSFEMEEETNVSSKIQANEESVQETNSVDNASSDTHEDFKHLSFEACKIVDNCVVSKDRSFNTLNEDNVSAQNSVVDSKEINDSKNNSEISNELVSSPPHQTESFENIACEKTAESLEKNDCLVVENCDEEKEILKDENKKSLLCENLENEESASKGNFEKEQQLVFKNYVEESSVEHSENKKSTANENIEIENSPLKNAVSENSSVVEIVTKENSQREESLFSKYSGKNETTVAENLKGEQSLAEKCLVAQSFEKEKSLDEEQFETNLNTAEESFREENIFINENSRKDNNLPEEISKQENHNVEESSKENENLTVKNSSNDGSKIAENGESLVQKNSSDFVETSFDFNLKKKIPSPEEKKEDLCSHPMKSEEFCEVGESNESCEESNLNLLSESHNSTFPFDSNECFGEKWNSEAGPVTAAEELFEDPSVFDFLNQRGKNAVIESNLNRKSLFVKFDPLVDSFSESLIENKISSHLESEKNREENKEDSKFLKIPVTPLKNPALEAVGKIISLTPTSAMTSPQTPAITPKTLNAELSKLQDLLIQQEEEFKAKLAEKDDRILELENVSAKLIVGMKKTEKYCSLLNEYENTISELVEQKESIAKDYEQKLKALEKERDTSMQHLNTLEIAFNDVHQKYERSKAVIENLKKNEDILRASVQEYDAAIKKQENKYDMLKQHARSQLDKANQELDVRTKSQDTELAKLRAFLKKSEVRCSSLQQTLEQKITENHELMKICDELINKVG